MVELLGPQRTAISVVSDSFEIKFPDLGMSLKRKSSSVRVSQLTDGPALRSGKINKGDRLLEIDCHAVENFCSADFRRFLIERDFENPRFTRQNHSLSKKFHHYSSLGKELKWMHED